MNAEEFDVLIVGSGGAGLSAALAATTLGGSACVVESGATIGGTYAYSSGLLWLPASRPAREDGVEDSIGEAREHILSLGGGRVRPDVLDAYLGSGEVLDFLADEGVPFEWIPGYPDYYAEHPGGRREGRYLAPPLFDPAELPEDWRGLAAESPYYTQMRVSWREIQSWGGYGTAASWDAELLAERSAKGIRGFGGATIGFLLAACLRHGVEFRLGTEMIGLETSAHGRVTGVHARGEDGPSQLRGRRGVILASGGYEQDLAMQRDLDDHVAAVPLTAPGVTGGPLKCALGLGARFLNLGGQLLAPVYRSGDDALNVALREVALPGGIVVNHHGQRFCDDAFYWSLGIGMGQFDAGTSSYANTPAFLVFDQRWKDTYRLGPVPAGEAPEWIARGESAEELASAVGIRDAGALRDTIAAYNGGAVHGEDRQFGRGSTAYARNSGDPANEPNPCVRAIEDTPLYAVPLELGSMGSRSGLAVDPDGAVLRVSGTRIEGLYACGNVMANTVEGRWYTSGVSNGRGIFFGVRAARSAMGQAAPSASVALADAAG